jgi:hypothetical protein
MELRVVFCIGKPSSYSYINVIQNDMKSDPTIVTT